MNPLMAARAYSAIQGTEMPASPAGGVQPSGFADMLMPLIAYNKSLGGNYIENIDPAIDKLGVFSRSQ